MENNYVCIMAGGIGSRFWPASREQKPKQFLDIIGSGKSLIRMTFERFASYIPASNIFVVTNKMYKQQVLEHLPELDESQVLVEPARKNTGPAVAYFSMRLQAINPNGVYVMAPADHFIEKEEVFNTNIKKALDFASKENVLLTLGITPTRPDTGYGYIHYGDANNNGFNKVQSFREKPDLETAQKYLDDGSYLWNAGIFVWSAKSILYSFEVNAPELYKKLNEGADKYNTSEEQEFIDKNYNEIESISVDYAILEKANNIFTLPSDIGWSDIGTWASLHALTAEGENKIQINSEDAVLDEVENCLIRVPKDKLVVIKGLEDFIVIDEEDVLLIYPKSQEQEIKALRNGLNKKEFT